MQTICAKHIAKQDPKMAAVIKLVGPCTLVPRRQRFQSLARAIVGQQISTKAAQSVFHRLKKEAGGYVTAERLAALSPVQLLSVGLSRQKVVYLHDLSARVINRTLRFDLLDAMEDEAVVQKLVAVKGIGRWTAEMFLMFVLNRPDILPVDDLGIQESFKRIYKLQARPTTKQMLKLAAPWQPYRTVGSWYLWRYLDVISQDD